MIWSDMMKYNARYKKLTTYNANGEYHGGLTDYNITKDITMQPNTNPDEFIPFYKFIVPADGTMRIITNCNGNNIVNVPFSVSWVDTTYSFKIAIADEEYNILATAYGRTGSTTYPGLSDILATGDLKALHAYYLCYKPNYTITSDTPSSIYLPNVTNIYFSADLVDNMERLLMFSEE